MTNRAIGKQPVLKRRPRSYWHVVIAGAVALAVPSIVLGVSDTIRIPVQKPHEEPAQAALFSHWEHNQFTCFSCHPSLFPQRPEGFTHADMDAGNYCGACHDGRTAFSYNDVDCATCHRQNLGSKQ